MTTRVKIEVTQEHLPVIVTVHAMSNSNVISTHPLNKAGEVYEGYVHNGQYLLVRELDARDFS